MRVRGGPGVVTAREDDEAVLLQGDAVEPRIGGAAGGHADVGGVVEDAGQHLGRVGDGEREGDGPRGGA